MYSFALAAAGMLVFSSCTVDQEAALHSEGAATSEKKEKKTKVKTDATESWSERMKVAKEEREKERAEAAKKKQQELAAKKKKEEEEARKLASDKKKEEAAEKALAEKKAEEKARAAAEKKALAEKEAKEKARADADRKALAQKKREERAAAKKAEHEAWLAKKRKQDEERSARYAARRNQEQGRGNEVAAVANRRGGGGFFSSFAVSTPNQYKSKGHHVHVDNRLLSSLNPSNAKIEISLSQQRARIYKTDGGMKQLVIETQISSGKSGHTTPTGTYRIKEKLQHKRSTLYGRWLNSSGQTVQSSGDSRKRPSGGSTFVGAEMPYWMRITGGIGMHIGYVPNGPASHGCIRVPSAVQPLIFSKVGIGTPVTITY